MSIQEFVIKGVISARSTQVARQIKDAVKNLCSEIIQAYKICTSHSSNEDIKRVMITLPPTIFPFINTVLEYTSSETNYCEVQSIKDLLLPVHERIYNIALKMQNEYSNMIGQDSEAFMKIFSFIKNILENLSEFFEHRHKVEVHRISDIGENAICEIRELHIMVDSDLLSQRIERANIYCDDFLKNVGILCVGQNSNPDLPNRFCQANLLFLGEYPRYIITVENKLCHNGDVNLENEHYFRIVNILEEVSKILKEISIIFNTDLSNVSLRNQSKCNNVLALNKSVDDILKNLAKLNSVINLDEREDLTQTLVRDQTKSLLQHLNDLQVGREDKVELVKAIKSGLNSNTPNDFFNARESINVVMDNITLQIDEEPPKLNEKDLLKAAQEMCESFKNLTSMLR